MEKHYYFAVQGVLQGLCLSLRIMYPSHEKKSYKCKPILKICKIIDMTCWTWIAMLSYLLFLLMVLLLQGPGSELQCASEWEGRCWGKGLEGGEACEGGAQF